MCSLVTIARVPEALSTSAMEVAGTNASNHVAARVKRCWVSNHNVVLVARVNIIGSRYPRCE